MTEMGGGALLTLLHLCDSLFPLGGFAHSDGLEWATASGAITTGAQLEAWLTVSLEETFGRADGVAIVSAWRAFHARDWNGLVVLDRELSALRPSSTARRASRAMGARLLSTWQTLRPGHALAEVQTRLRDGSGGPTLPVAFALACASANVDRRSTAEAFAYTRLAATVSAAMRLMSIGQIEAHTLLAGALADVPRIVEGLDARPQMPRSFAPMMDHALMAQQYLHSRLFRS